MSKQIEEFIAKEILELDKDYSEYQRLHRKFHMEADMKAKIIYEHLMDVYTNIMKKLARK